MQSLPSAKSPNWILIAFCAASFAACNDDASTTVGTTSKTETVQARPGEDVEEVPGFLGENDPGVVIGDGTMSLNDIRLSIPANFSAKRFRIQLNAISHNELRSDVLSKFKLLDATVYRVVVFDADT